MDKPISSATFTYRDVPPEHRGALRAAAKGVRRNTTKAGKSIFAVGRALLDAKKLIDYGLFIAWLDSEFRWTPRTAQYLMRIARVFDGRYEAFSHLPQRTLLAVASRAVSPEARERIFEMARIDDFRPISAAAIEREIGKTPRAWDADGSSSGDVGRAFEKDVPGTTVVDDPIGMEIARFAEEYIASGRAIDILTGEPVQTTGNARLLALRRVAAILLRNTTRIEHMRLRADLEHLGYDELADAVIEVDIEREDRGTIFGPSRIARP